MTRRRVFSGIQPSGQITLGNYLGALKQFVHLQEEADAYYCVVDLHAITVPQDPKLLRERILDLASLYIAVGLDPHKSTLFVQSDVSEHSELGWILQCNAHMGELSRMTQYKEKAEGKEHVSVGLFTYPALMAADILLYQTNFVPVGEDQKQHLELTRDIAERFNNRFGETFVLPEVLMMEQGARIMSLDDPTKKMSKSNPNPQSRIEMLDTPDAIRKKLSRAVTDSDREVRFDPVNKPAVSNLLVIYSLSADKSIQTLESEYQGRGYGEFKKDLAEVLVETLTPIQERYTQIRNSGEIQDLLKQGADRARQVAAATMERVKRQVGLGGTTL
ncbi:tryptophan--tRNA ligase [Sulfoacidibacillus thermotolerans]|uniref:Tryptophan--tRNA ligase n=1 Tax=Sulfoacidibacillus thermotolerans TaxID=1765684 RepID=A0A2U3D5V8_SULT2|nr:tryptophan--tRNA ligase [Sulfoacidibacillus thermotolerans]PWI56665.1 tryptophan--tRNA ligase [Sulfoacidibacillus thermotolerans]